MRHLLIIPLIVLLGAAGAWGVFHVRGQSEPLHELAVAALVSAVAGELALIPSMVAQRHGSIAVAQASLVGTVAHLFLTLVLAAGVWASHVMSMQRPTFVLLLLTFYWISLIGLVIALVRITRMTAASALQTAGGRVS